MTPWPHGHVKSRGKLKTYNPIHKACDLQTWQGGDLGEGNSLMMSHDPLNIGKVATYDERNSPIMSGDSMTK